MATEPTLFEIRERAVLTVFDHSGAAPRAVEEIEIVAITGQPISRTVRTFGELEAIRLAADRAGGGVQAVTLAFLREDWRRTVEDAWALTRWAVGKKAGD